MTVQIPDDVFADAVEHFWLTRSGQAKQQKKSGGSDQGTRGAVTGGKQMDGFAQVITDLMIEAGVTESDIYPTKNRELPGFFRPAKDWDIVVVSEGQLRAAIELKSQVGSFGNNFNNRAEEIIGLGVDLWTAYRERAFGTSPPPWLGFLFVLEDAPASRSAVAIREPHFKAFKEFRDASYAKRYEILYRRLVLERHYSSTCLLMGKPAEPRVYSEPAPDLGANQFLDQLLRHVGSGPAGPRA